MINFIDEYGKQHAAIVECQKTKGVNGEKSLSGTIYTNDEILEGIGRGWRLQFEDENYCLTYVNPLDEGNRIVVEFDAVHEFFFDLKKSVVYSEMNGSNTANAYLQFIFNGSGYEYRLEVTIPAFEKESFGIKNRLDLFKDFISSTGVEFSVNGKIVRILEKVGTNLSTVVKKGFNLNELRIEKDPGSFITYLRGYGAFVDPDDESKGRLVVEYLSPLAEMFGKLEGDPIIDERYTLPNSLKDKLKIEVENSYGISVDIDMEDLTRSGYEYDQPHEGDYIMAINKDLGFEQKIRIMSYTTSYDTEGNIIDHDVSCGSDNIIQKKINQDNEYRKEVQAGLENAVNTANQAWISADGKNKVFQGPDRPKATNKGDIWYQIDGDQTIMNYWNGYDWVPFINPDAVKDSVEDAKKAGQEAQLAAEAAEQAGKDAQAAGEAAQLAASDAKQAGDTAVALANQADIDAKAAKAKADAIQIDVDGLVSDVATINGTVTSISGKANEAYAKANAVEGRTSTLETSVTGLTGRMTDIESTSTSTTKKLNELVVTVDGQTQTLAATTTTANSALNKANVLETSVDGVTRTLSSVESTVSNIGAQGTNLLINGGFENDLFGWTGDPVHKIDTVDKHSGIKALMIDASGSVKMLNLNVRIPVYQGQQLEFSMWYKTTTDFNGTSNNNKFRIGKQDGSLLTSYGWDGALTEWTNRVATLTVGSGISELTLRIDSTHSTGKVWWDDISITDVTNRNQTNIKVNQITETVDGHTQLIASTTNTANSALSKATSTEITVNGLKNTVIDVQTTANSAMTKATQVEQTATGILQTVSQISSSGSNMVTNSSFENDFIGWGNSTRHSIDTGSANVHTGSKSLKIDAGSGTTSIAPSSNTFPVIPGRKYEISYWYKTTPDANGTTDNQKLRLANSAGSLLQGLAWSGSQTEWTRNSAIYTAGTNIYEWKFAIIANHTVGTVWWDDISILDVTDQVTLSSQITQLSDQMNFKLTSSDGGVTQIDMQNKIVTIASENIYLTGKSYISDAVIKTAHIVDLAVSNGKIANLAVTEGKIANLAVTTAKIADLAVSNAKIGDAAITNAKIGNLAVSTAKIADAAITDAKIGNLSANKINTGTLNAANVNVINLNASNITTGTISGANLTINLATGEVLFSKGTIANTAGTFSLDIDNDEYYSQGNVASATSEKTVIVLKSGALRSAHHLDSAGKIINMVVYGSNGISSYTPRSRSGTIDPKANIYTSGIQKTVNILMGNTEPTNSTTTYGYFTLDTYSVTNGGTSSLSSMPYFHIAGSTKSATLSADSKVDLVAMTGTVGLRGTQVDINFGGESSSSGGMSFGSDGSGGKVWSTAIFNRTTGSAANVFVSGGGILARSTSARKYKTNIQEIPNILDKAERLYDIKPVSWLDIAEIKLNGKSNTYYGFIADDFNNIGLNEVVTYNDKGEVDALAYDRIAIYTIPLIQSLKQEVDKLKERIKELEAA